jgi:ribokinase
LAWEQQTTTGSENEPLLSKIDNLLEGVECILLQREVPEYVNLLIATRAKQKGNNIIVIQDVGGEDRPISSELLQCCDYLIPNESELKRLVESSGAQKPTIEDEQDEDSVIVAYAKCLQTLGACNVLVTRGSQGSTLVTDKGETIHQSAFHLPKLHVIDETGAGDCYRAAFAVALLEGH